MPSPQSPPYQPPPAPAAAAAQPYAAPGAYGVPPPGASGSEYGTPSDYGTDELSSDANRTQTQGAHSASTRRSGRSGGRNKRQSSRRQPNAAPQPHAPAAGAGYSSSESGGEFAAAPWLRRLTVPAPPASQPQTPAEARVPLGEEVLDFAAFMALTPEEKASRNMLRSALQDAARHHWPGSTVKVYGSFAYGLSLPASDVDVIVEDCHVSLTGSFAVFVNYLRQSGYEVLGSVEGNGVDAFLKARSKKSGLIANVTVTVGKSPVRQSVGVVKQLLAQFPAAGSVTLVVRTVLGQCNLNDVAGGGISSFALLLMVFHLFLSKYTEEEGRRKDAGEALRDFLQYYGAEFDFATHSVAITASGEGAPYRMHSNGQVSVCDPLDPDNNVADTCTKIAQIKAMFKYCHMALAKWDQVIGPADVAAFRGRTPLSTVIAHKALWGRKVKRELQTELAMPPPPAPQLAPPPPPPAPPAQSASLCPHTPAQQWQPPPSGYQQYPYQSPVACAPPQYPPVSEGGYAVGASYCGPQYDAQYEVQYDPQPAEQQGERVDV